MYLASRTPRIEALKQWLVLKSPLVRYWFGRLKSPRLWRTIQFERWARRTARDFDRYEFADAIVREKRVYVSTSRGILLEYVPSAPYSVLDMELRDEDFEA